MWYQNLEDKYAFPAEELNAKSLIDYIACTENLTEIISNVDKERSISGNKSQISGSNFENFYLGDKILSWPVVLIY